MATDYVAERERVGEILSTFTACPIVWPGTDKRPPALSSDPSTPASHIVVEIPIDAAERATFSGEAQIRGRVSFDIRVQRDRGDDTVRDLMETLRTLFATADTDGFQFLEPVPGTPYLAGDSSEWYGRPFDVPFVRWRT